MYKQLFVHAISAQTIQSSQRHHCAAHTPVLAEAIRSGPRAAVPGSSANAATPGSPFNPWLRSPEAADLLQQLGTYLRFRSSLPPRLNEFAILITARQWDSQYEWY